MQSHHRPQRRRIHEWHFREIDNCYRIVPRPGDRLELENPLQYKRPIQANYADALPSSRQRFDLEFIH